MKRMKRMADRNVDPIKMNYFETMMAKDEELVRMNDYCLLSDFVVTENYIMTCIGINAQCNAK